MSEKWAFFQVYPRLKQGTPGTMTPFWQLKRLAISDSGAPTEAQVTRLLCSNTLHVISEKVLPRALFMTEQS